MSCTDHGSWRKARRAHPNCGGSTTPTRGPTNTGGGGPYGRELEWRISDGLWQQLSEAEMAAVAAKRDEIEAQFGDDPIRLYTELARYFESEQMYLDAALALDEILVRTPPLEQGETLDWMYRTLVAGGYETAAAEYGELLLAAQSDRGFKLDDAAAVRQMEEILSSTMQFYERGGAQEDFGRLVQLRADFLAANGIR